MQQSIINASLRRKAIGFAFLFLVFLAGTVNLNSPPGWDEGWTLLVARNWVERGHYGRLLEGEPASNGLEAAFPVVWPIALSFRLLGIGVWQGRMPGVLFTFGALALLYYLASQLYNRAVAWGTLYAVLFLLNLASINPILNGRSALADMPMMFYLLAGYACFLAAWRRPAIFLPLSALFWGIAILTKAQTLPFWLLSLAIPLGLALFQRHWWPAVLLLGGISGSWYASRGLLILQGWILQGHTVPGEAIQGINQAVALVPLLNVRARALIVLGVSGLPTLFALMYTACRYYKRRNPLSMSNGSEVVKLALFILTGSWLGWFILLSNSGPRYLNAPGFLGGIFVSAMLYELTDRFDFRSTIQHGAEVLKLRHFDGAGLGAVFAIVVAVPMALVTVTMFYPGIFHKDDNVRQLAHFLNTQTPPDSLIETYESELLFFLDRPYHYPPDRVHVELIRRYYFEQEFEIDYDPLAADPDYLVVGPTSAAWGLYDLALRTGEFRLLKTYGWYSLYERVR